NVDDLGRVFLNGHPLSPSVFSGDPHVITTFGNATFSTSDASLFRPGVNIFLVSDINLGGPSGAAFFATITYATVPVAGAGAGGNVISGNGSTGVLIGWGATGNRVQANDIGSNGGSGVYVFEASDNTVGGTAGGTGNQIAFNSGAGVVIAIGTGNAI